MEQGALPDSRKPAAGPMNSTRTPSATRTRRSIAKAGTMTMNDTDTINGATTLATG